ncbi:hypothetical protein K0M31_002672 [Melipona bicolor]|uniref:Uncharacterized protein n=1 Tax=Melipona bicolor TaxID=60889 RepID=A0AA40KPT4_9HYME|nr:hypothetical protein K0M31_002672 [Melipona bicolor]
MSKQESKGPPPPPLPPPYSHQKLFKKCKSATFQLDGATYTIGIVKNILRNNINYICYSMIFQVVRNLGNSRRKIRLLKLARKDLNG